jgi:uncharacterized membrane protein YjjP (DUF1212 family)
MALSHSELAEILALAIRIGQLMLRSGAASFRTEQTMTRVGLAMGVDRIETYITPTGIIASAYSGSEHRTQIARMHSLGVNMARITALETLTRNLPAEITPAKLTALLDNIETTPPEYPQWVVILAVGLACAAFCLILGGGAIEALAAFTGAATAQTIRFRLNAIRLNPLATTVLCAATATAISLALVRMFITPFPRLGVIASVLLLVPGVPLVTSILDITRFDLVSGMARGLYAGLLIISIGIGMLVVLALVGFTIL